jgi:hypothetical protein
MPDSYLPFSMNLVSQVIGFYAKLPGYDRPDRTGSTLVGQVRDVVKSILRGVSDYYQQANQSTWYPSPALATPGLTSGQTFGVYSLDPYVWFVHRVLGMSGYGFSVDDDVSNPTATGPLLAENGSPNHTPNNLQIQFGGIGRLGNTSQWFPTTPWGSLSGPTVRATIVQIAAPNNPYNGKYAIQFQGPNALKYYNMINNPGDGQVGAGITSSLPGYFAAGTTLVHKGPVSGLIPQIVLSLAPLKTTATAIPVTISADTPTSSTTSLGTIRPRPRPRVGVARSSRADSLAALRRLRFERIQAR